MLYLTDWVRHRFQKSLFSPVHTTTQRFRKPPFSPKTETFLGYRPHVYVFKSTPFSKVSVFARPHDNAAFSKVSTFEPVLGHAHTYTFSCENGDFSARFRLPSTRKRLFSVFESLRFHRKRRLFENGFESGDFRKWRLSKTLRCRVDGRKRCAVVWTGENGDF